MTALRQIPGAGAGLGMKRACEIVCQEKGLTIKWEALRDHVKGKRRKLYK